MASIFTWLPLYVACCFRFSVFGEVFSSDVENEIEQYVQHVMECRHIPGMAVTVVKSGETWVRGYGVADLATGRPVNNETKFFIGSLTKAFTATVLGKLLEEKGYNWDTPVTEILGKNYILVDDQRTSQTTVKDLLSHRTGLANPSIAVSSGYRLNGYTRQDMCMRFRYIPEKFGFRDKFVYNNFMYTYAGCIIEKLANKPWEEAVKTHLFQPIGMTLSEVQVPPNILKVPGIALPYLHQDGKWINGNEDSYIISPFEPAGSILSNGNDMGKWLHFLLRKGVTDTGERLVSEGLIDDMMTTQMAFDSEEYSGFQISKPNFPVGDMKTGYGYGWITAIYRGYKKISHSGGFISYISRNWIFPEKDTAIFVSSNLGTPATDLAEKSVMYFISDLLLNVNSWLNESTACSFPSPWDTSDPTPKTTYPVIVEVTVDELSEHVGKYGSHVWGDVNIVIPDDGTLTLMVHINRLVVGKLHPVGRKGSFLFQQTMPHEQRVDLNSSSLIECSFYNSCKNCNQGSFVMKTKQGTITFHKDVRFSDPIPVPGGNNVAWSNTGIHTSVVCSLLTITIRSALNI